MKHIINGCPVNLRGLSAQELDNIVAHTEARMTRCQEELESLRGEQVRRSGVIPLFPGRLVEAPVYLMDPA